MKRTLWVIFLSLTIIGLGVWDLALGASVNEPRTQLYSAPALYNLGNSYARAGKSALAVLNYERARVLAPMDPDIRANLRHIREFVGLPVRSDSWRDQIAGFVSLNTMYGIGLAGLTLAGASLLQREVRSEHRAALTVTAIVGLALMTLSLFDAVAAAPLLSESVVMQAVPASASPVSSAEPLFTLSQAEFVHVLDEHRGYSLIRDSHGREGWVGRMSLAPVIPRQESSHEAPAT